MSSGYASGDGVRRAGFGRVAGWLAVLLLAVSCRSATLSPEAESVIEEELRAALESFEEAQGALDVEGVMRWIAPEFTMLQDGKRVDYAIVSDQIRATLPTLRSFDASFEDVEVFVLSEDAAYSSFLFRDVIVDGEGNTTRSYGPTTFVWRRIDGQWRLVYADSDHYVPEDAE